MSEYISDLLKKLRRIINGKATTEERQDVKLTALAVAIIIGLIFFVTFTIVVNFTGLSGAVGTSLALMGLLAYGIYRLCSPNSQQIQTPCIQNYEYFLTKNMFIIVCSLNDVLPIRMPSDEMRIVSETQFIHTIQGVVFECNIQKRDINLPLDADERDDIALYVSDDLEHRQKFNKMDGINAIYDNRFYPYFRLFEVVDAGKFIKLRIAMN